MQVILSYKLVVAVTIYYTNENAPLHISYWTFFIPLDLLEQKRKNEYYIVICNPYLKFHFYFKYSTEIGMKLKY